MKRWNLFYLALASAALFASCESSDNAAEDEGTESPVTEGTWSFEETSDDLSATQHAIINGSKDTYRLHKAVVSLYLKDRSGYNNQSICTGTLIHPQWVLTAAHCVADNIMNYSYASSNNPYLKIGVGNTPNEIENNLYDIDQIIFHPNYGAKIVNGMNTIANDIALIKLRYSMNDSDVYPIPPLRLDNGVTRDQIKNGVSVDFVGFGLDENGNSGTKLKYSQRITSYCGSKHGDSINGCYYGTVTVNGCSPDKSKCNNSANRAYCSSGYFCMNDPNFKVLLPHGSIYYEHNPGGTCNGDSGGPAIITNNGWEYVAGVTSYGDSACAKIGVHTAVQDFYDSFILKYAPEVKTYHDKRMSEWSSESNYHNCGAEHTKYCKARYNNATCYFPGTDNTYICTDYCDTKDNYKTWCQKDNDGKYRTYKTTCIQLNNGRLVWSANAVAETCDNGCNNNMTECYVDKVQQAWDNEIKSGICGEQHLKKCAENHNNTNGVCYFIEEGKSDYMCTFGCNAEGEKQDRCKSINGQDTYYPLVCKNVHGKLMMVRDMSQAQACANGCNGNICKDDSTVNWNNEIKSGICGPEHVKKCIETHGTAYNACYFLNDKGNYQCTAKCPESMINKLIASQCRQNAETGEFQTQLAFCVDKGNGPVIYVTPDKTLTCDYGCDESGLLCKPAPKKETFTETFDGIAKSNRYESGIFESPNTSVQWSYNGRTALDKYGIDGEGIILKDGGYITGFAHSGVRSISVEVMKAFTSKKPRSISLAINGEVCDSLSDMADDEVMKLSCTPDLENDVEISIRSDADQVTVDNIQWISY